MVRQFYAVTYELSADPSKPLTQLEDVAVGIDLTAWQHDLQLQRDAGRKVVGESRLVLVEIDSVNMDNSDPGNGRVPTVAVDVCWDVSGVDVVDSSGAVVTPTDRPDRGWTRHLVSNYEWDANPTGAWRVASSTDLNERPCAGS